MTGKTGRVEDQWCFPVKELTKEQIMEVAARCVEIAIRIVFENFIYSELE